MIQAYFISGLGADASVFSKLRLDDQIEVHHIPWIEPGENEPLDDYSVRMASSIENPASAVLVGLSFGGVMAIEIAKRMHVKHVILISSIKRREEMPLHLNLIGLFNLHQYVPASRLLHFKPLVNWFFGIRAGEEAKMFENIIDRTNESLVDWSSDQIVQWQGEHDIKRITHIHGTADTVFPVRRVAADYVVEGGPHFMVYTHAAEVSKLLNSTFARLKDT